MFTSVKLKVKDFDAWKKFFVEHKDERKGAGSKGAKVFTNPQDKNEITVLMEVADLGKFKEFMDSPDLKEKMKDSGMIGPPDITVLEHSFDLDS